MRLRLSLVLVSLAGVIVSAQEVVDLGYAKYKGDAAKVPGYTAFYGLRYAVAERFGAPRSPHSLASKGIINADDTHTVCFQGLTENAAAAGKNQSEDCLLLDVYTPLNASNSHDRLPVLVYIHGGSYQLNSKNEVDPTVMAEHSDQRFILVSINYRLGVFGFNQGKEYHKLGGVANGALLDQQEALRWIQKHIAKFGGDPKRVVLSGQSAGAGSVLQHVVSPRAKGLFKTVWTMSAFLPPQPTAVGETSSKTYKELVDVAGCAKVRNSLKCLRKLDANAMLNASLVLSNKSTYTYFPWQPVIDGKVIVENPYKTLGEGRRAINGQAILVGSQVNEGVIILYQNQTTPAETHKEVRRLFPRLSEHRVQQLLRLYPRVDNENGRVAELISDGFFKCAANALASAFHARGKAAYRYSIEVLPSLHGQDLVYFYNRSTDLRDFYGLPQPDVVPSVVKQTTRFLFAKDVSASSSSYAGVKYVPSDEKLMSYDSKHKTLTPWTFRGVNLKNETAASGVQREATSAKITSAAVGNKDDVCRFWIDNFPDLY